ncbi:MAG: DUF1361 domain-containing protein [Bacteroidales bacterium]|nr:DUF1361 domain-containing protein [Bacteroidales bacterium]
MWKTLKAKNRLNETIFMGILAFFCFGSSLFRYVYTDTTVFLFLNWNLFLAFIPWALTSLVIFRPKLQQSKISFVVLLISWLLFFPNAPYILTDLFHLSLESSMPIWFDLVLILSFAWTGLLFGFLSLWDIERIMLVSIKRTYVLMISIGLMFIGSFGIYVGRFLLWNSWDLLTKPFNLIFDVGDQIMNPFEHPRAWGMIIFMGLFLNILYLSFRLIRKREE